MIRERELIQEMLSFLRTPFIGTHEYHQRRRELIAKAKEALGETERLTESFEEKRR